jgi:hypothetical protein
MGDWRYSFIILNLGTRWRWVVSFTLRPLYSQGNSPRYPLYERLDGALSSSGCYGKKKTLVPAGNRTPTVQPLACRYTDWSIPALCRRYATTKNSQNYSGTFSVYYGWAVWPSLCIRKVLTSNPGWDTFCLGLRFFRSSSVPSRKISKQYLNYVTTVSF